MKLLAVLITSLVLAGCATTDVVSKDQLILKVPDQLLVPPAPLKKL
jgi:outer membrane murein-binding lipoprotein Lpp